MINFDRYENSEKLRTLDSSNIVIHDNMNTLKVIFSKVPDEIVFSDEESNVIDKINKLIRMESLVSSLWEKATTKALVLFKKKEIIIDDKLPRKINELESLGDLILDSNVRKKPLSIEIDEEITNISNFGFICFFVASLIGVITSFILSMITENLFLVLIALLSCALSVFIFCLFNDSDIDSVLKFNSKSSTLVALFGLITLNPIVIFLGLLPRFLHSNRLKEIRDNEQLNVLNNITDSDLKYIVDNLSYDSYVYKLVDVVENWPKTVTVESKELFDDHVQKMIESIKLINQFREEEI